MSPGGARLKDEGTRLQVVSAGAFAGLVSRFVYTSICQLSCARALTIVATASS